MAVFGANVERWRKPLTQIAQWVPIDFLLSWIAKESDGDLDSTTTLGEKGLFQVKPGQDDEQGFLKLSDADFNRLTEPMFSLQTGVRQAMLYAQSARQTLKNVGAEWHGRDFWKLVKLHHNAFAMPHYAVLAYQRLQGHAPESWDDLKHFVTAAALAGQDLVPENAKLSGRLRALAGKIFANADEVGNVLPAWKPNEIASAQQLLKAHQVG